MADDKHQELSSEQTWHRFVNQTKGMGPRPTLVQAMTFAMRREQALDLGSGALNDSRYLLDQGFEHVTAVDKYPVGAEFAATLDPARFTYVTSSFEDFRFPRDAFDLINAQFSLPFIAPGEFTRVFEAIVGSLAGNGILVGQLFGDRDEWRDNPTMTFHPRREAEKLFALLRRLSFSEEDRDGQTASKTPKHWHVFHFIAQKWPAPAETHRER